MPFTVNTYQDPKQLADATGLEIIALLDEQQLENQLETGDAVITNGAFFTLIKGGVPVGTQILGKGNLYTVIIETA